MTARGSTLYTAARERYLREELDPYAAEQHGTRTAWLYAYLYGHPGFDRLPLGTVPEAIMSWCDIFMYMSFAGLLDYLLIWSLLSFWPFYWLLPYVVGETLGRHPTSMLLVLSFLFRARISGLMEYISRKETSKKDAAAAALELCGAAYWHVVLKCLWRLRIPISYRTVLRLVISFMSDGKGTYGLLDAALKVTEPKTNITMKSIFCESVKDGLIAAVTPILPMVLVSVGSIFIFAVSWLASFISQRRPWIKVVRFLDDAWDKAEVGVDRVAELVVRWAKTPLAGAAKVLCSVAGRVLVALVAVHILSWSGEAGPVDGDKLNGDKVDGDEADGHKVDGHKVLAEHWKRRQLTLVAIHNFRQEVSICYWPPSHALTLSNIQSASSATYSQIAYSWGKLRRRHPPRDNPPYKDLGVNEIRVLRLFPAEFEAQELEVELLIRPLHDPGPYQAVSYHWGDHWSGPNTKSDCSVIVNGYRLAVKPGTYEALRALRTPFQTQTVWIDAVCINQSDIAERSAQVQLMASIYERATKVVVWLGEPADAALAVRMLRAVWARLRLLDVDDRDITTLIFMPRLVSPSWRALKGLTRRPWFERAWVAQEITVAAAAEVRYGPETLPWNLFASFAFLIWASPLKRGLSSDYNLDTERLVETSNIGARQRFGVPWDFAASLGQLAVPRSLDPVLKTHFWIDRAAGMAPATADGAFGLHHCQILQQLAVLRRSGKSETLDVLVRKLYHGAGCFKSSDPRDKVYAALSMSEERYVPEFTPDYGAPAAEAYTKVAAYFATRGTPFLAESGRGYEYAFQHHKCEMQEKGCGCARCGRLPDKLPSWVPNWSAARSHAPLELTADDHALHQCIEALGSAGQEALSELTRGRFSASGISTFSATALRSPSPPGTGDRSTARGPGGLRVAHRCHLTTVTHLAAPYAPAYVQGRVGDVDGTLPQDLYWNPYAAGENMPVHGPDSWLVFASAHIPATYAHSVGGQLMTRKEAFWRTLLADDTTGLDVANKAEIETLYDDYVDRLLRVQVGREEPLVVLESDEVRRHMMFRGQIGKACLGRRMGVAEGAYLGMFPLGAKVGDEVWLIAGVRTPILLRSCREEWWKRPTEEWGMRGGVGMERKCLRTWVSAISTGSWMGRYGVKASWSGRRCCYGDKVSQPAGPANCHNCHGHGAT